MSTALKTAPGHRLRADAAAAFDAANSARRWVLTDSERPLATQIRIFLERYLPARTGGGHYGDIRWWNGVRYVRRKGFAAAAVPGTSKHGTGTAIDVTGLGHVGSPTWEAFRRDVEPHGWRHPDWAKTSNFYEPWHWEYNPALDAHPVSRPGAGGSITVPTIPDAPASISPTAPTHQEIDMPMLIQSPEDGIWLLDGGVRHPISDESITGLTGKLGAPAGVTTQFLRGVPRAGANQLLLIQAPGRGIGLITGGGFVPVQEMDTVAKLQSSGVALRELAAPAFDALASA